MQNWNMHIQGSITMHTGRSILFILYLKWMVRFFYYYYIHFFNCCFKWICLTNNIVFLQDTILEHELRSIELFMEMYVWNDNHHKGVQQLLDSRAQYFMVCWISIIAFLKLLFFWIWWICFFRKHITLSCRRDPKTIFRPIQNYDWRKDCQVDLIEIKFTIS